MVGKQPTAEQRIDLESRVLLAALKQSIDRGDVDGAALAHTQLSGLLTRKQQAITCSDLPAAGQRGSDRGSIAECVGRRVSSGTPLPLGQAVSQQSPADAKELASEKNVEVPTGDEDAVSAVAAQDATAVDCEPTGVEAAADAADSAVVPAGSYYELLSVLPISTFTVIHVHFLRQVRRLLRERADRDTTVWQFRDLLKALCVAHDVLRDPLTRTDYDFRLLGLRGAGGAVQVAIPADVTERNLNRRPLLKIGELLQCSGVLDIKELEIAVDMHKAMPEMPFGQFLVRQDFLTQKVLDSALLGQRLIADGKITVAQFQVVMHDVGSLNTSLGDALVDRGWVPLEDINARVQDDPWDRKVLLTEIPCPVSHAKVGGGENNSHSPGPIAASNALPSWAGQLDWEAIDERQLAQDMSVPPEQAASSWQLGAVEQAESARSEQTEKELSPLELTGGTIVGQLKSSDSDASVLESLSTSLEESLALEIHRLELEGPLLVREPEDDLAGIELNLGREADLAAGELESPPWPGEMKPATRGKGDRSSKKVKQDKQSQGHLRAKRAKQPGDSGLSNLDDDVK